MRRQIGYDQQVADRVHFCDRCCRHIMPGEMYERAVYLNAPRTVMDMVCSAIKLDTRHRVTVDKRHVNPGCDYPWDDENSEEYRLEQQMREEVAREAERADSSEVAA